jgi:hypothetical protein
VCTSEELRAASPTIYRDWLKLHGVFNNTMGLLFYHFDYSSIVFPELLLKEIPNLYVYIYIYIFLMISGFVCYYCHY